jgi:hypothetical protein
VGSEFCGLSPFRFTWKDSAVPPVFTTLARSPVASRSPFNMGTMYLHHTGAHPSPNWRRYSKLRRRTPRLAKCLYVLPRPEQHLQ